jgi:hypothetical protein
VAAAMAAECVVLVVVRTVVVVCVVVCEQHLVCELGGQVSEARVVRTFLANDAAYLTLLGAVTQLRRSEIVTLGVGLPVVVLCGVFNESWVSADCPFLRIKTQHIIIFADRQPTPRHSGARRWRVRRFGCGGARGR